MEQKFLSGAPLKRYLEDLDITLQEFFKLRK
jgi:hypothetical protein